MATVVEGGRGGGGGDVNFGSSGSFGIIFGCCCSGGTGTGSGCCCTGILEAQVEDALDCDCDCDVDLRYSGDFSLLDVVMDGVRDRFDLRSVRRDLFDF